MQNAEDVIIITGATGNLGSATAHAFQAAGQRMVLVDRSEERLRDAFVRLADSPQYLLAGGVEVVEDAFGRQRVARFGFGKTDSTARQSFKASFQPAVARAK